MTMCACKMYIYCIGKQIVPWPSLVMEPKVSTFLTLDIEFQLRCVNNDDMMKYLTINVPYFLKVLKRQCACM
jgi:hypothetical protein